MAIKSVEFYSPMESQRDVFRQCKQLIFKSLPAESIYKKAVQDWADNDRIVRQDVSGSDEIFFDILKVCSKMDEYIIEGTVCCLYEVLMPDGDKQHIVLHGIKQYRDRDEYIKALEIFQSTAPEKFKGNIS